MNTEPDFLDEEPYDPLDEAPMEPDYEFVKGGSDEVEGFGGTVREARHRSGQLVASPKRGSTEKSIRRRRAFLRALAQTGNISLAAAAAGWSRWTAVHFRKTDKDFAAAWDMALEVAADLVEAELHRRAVFGVEEPVWHKPKEGEPIVIGHVTKYSDSLMQTLIKGLKPEKYRERHEVQHEASKGGVLVVPTAVPLDEWEAAAARQQTQYREKGTPDE